MFGMRRYRLFLLVAALSAATIYYLSQRGSWDIADLNRINSNPLKHDTLEKPSIPDPIDDHSIPHPPPAVDEGVVTPVEPTKPPSPKVTDRIEPLSSSGAESASSASSDTTSNRNKQPLPTTTGGKLLITPGDDESPFEDGSGRFEPGELPGSGRRVRWRKPVAHFPLPKQDIIALPNSSAKKLAKIQAPFVSESPTERRDRISKLATIKESFKHAWNGYQKYGLPHDEVRPIGKSFADPFMGWGATLVDTLDTLWIMGLENDFEGALIEVGKIDFKSSFRKDIPLFETVIRYLGGLVGAYDVSEQKYPVLLEKAEELAEILIGAFDTPNRMPVTFYKWAPSYTSQPHRANAHSVMSELGSLSLEFTRLAQITGKDEYYDAIARVTDELEKWQPDTLMPGLWPLKVDASGCRKALHGSTTDMDVDEEIPIKPMLVDTDVAGLDISGETPATYENIRGHPKDYEGTPPDKTKRDKAPGSQDLDVQDPKTKREKMNQQILDVECTKQGLAPEAYAKSQAFGIGGQADSTYEYFPKMYALLRGRNKQYQTMYIDSAKAIRDDLLFRPMIKQKNREILFASKHDLNPKAKKADQRHITTYEVTHLSCFAGGMFGLGSKLFGIEDDMELAAQLTDGCVWAYESMPTGIMAESAAVVPCPNMDVCAWNETRWHEALDPKRQDRFKAVEAWNSNQQAIYERSRMEATRNIKIDSEAAKPVQTKLPSEDDVGLEKRAMSDLTDEADMAETSDKIPSRTSTTAHFDEDDGETEMDIHDHRGTSTTSKFLAFVPKTAVPHDKYVKERIAEERLPSSYTDIFERKYILRPEAIESVFYMYRLTGDRTWQAKGWKMFEAIQQATQTETANAALRDVTSLLGELEDSMESFWLAETLKYFYLLFDERTAKEGGLGLDEWVSNTEAHFFRIPA